MEYTYLSYFDQKRILKELIKETYNRDKHYSHIIEQQILYIEQTLVTLSNQDDISHRFYVIYYFQPLQQLNKQKRKEFLNEIQKLID